MTPNTNGSLGLHHQTFCPSDILHSRDWASAVDVACPIEGHHVIICHKDRTTFYKATRKVRRTAGRILRRALPSDPSSAGNAFPPLYGGYFVGEERPSPSAANGENANAAIHKRLSSEFGNERENEINVDLSNVSVRKYGSEDCGALGRIKVGEGSSDMERVNVIFLDLDSINSTDVQDVSFWNMHLFLMQKILSLLMRQVATGKNSVIHLRSETMYRVVTSMAPGASVDGQKSYCVSGVEFARNFLSVPNKGDAEGDNTSSGSGAIRRLRDKKGAANCPLTIYPARFIELPSCSPYSDINRKSTKAVEICRFHNYDAERGCLRSKKAQRNSQVKGCGMDHDHCHRCGGGHRALECPNSPSRDDAPLSSVVFRKGADGSVISTPYLGHDMNSDASRYTASLPALLVLGGRLRGRTLATCEMLQLSSSANENDERRWVALPNLHEHRGSHAACSPAGSGLVFVLGGGTADGNSDTAEILDFGSEKVENNRGDATNGIDCELRWRMMAGKLSSPRHAFGAVSCATRKQTGEHGTRASSSLFAVGGWKYGSVSCECMERLTLKYPFARNPAEHGLDSSWLHEHARWELCSPLLLPRRLHSVAASTDGSSIFVFGGYIDARRTTPSIERYDIDGDCWSASDDLPFGERNCPLVEAVSDQNGFLVFPFSTERMEDNDAPSVLRYTPGSVPPFSLILVPNDDNDLEKHLRLPIANWHSFSATSSPRLRKAFLVGGTIDGKWTDRSYELDLRRYEWKELPPMTVARRRLATLVLE